MTYARQHERAVPHHLWLILVITTVVFALTVSLAGRVFHGKSSDATTIQSIHAFDRGQYLDRDAYDWTKATVQSHYLILVVTFALLAKEVPRALALHREHCGYNRPPPSC